ncbi:MAG: hypothetical protein JWM74_2560 [Myxococcaceae bacterium]|nr:hypothetical protein [Myxococcaceae bacterium]
MTQRARMIRWLDARWVVVVAGLAGPACSQQECTVSTESNTLTYPESLLTAEASGRFTIRDGVDRGTYESCNTYCARLPRLKSVDACTGPALSPAGAQEKEGHWAIECRGPWETCTGNASPNVPSN